MLYWPFFRFPIGAVIVAAFFAICFVAVRNSTNRASGPLLIAACLWLAYAAWEWYCTAGQFNIRVDLLVIPWFLYIFSAYSVLCMWFRKS